MRGYARAAEDVELHVAIDAFSAQRDERETAAAVLKDELVIRLREHPDFLECLRSYASTDDDADLRIALANWHAAGNAHRSASNAFLRAIGHVR